MQRVVVRRPGGVAHLLTEEAPDPVPQPREVCVSVRAVGVNFADLVVRMGLYKSAREYVGWPITPGFELAGTVDAIGSEVVNFKPGDRVLGVTRFGAYTTRICLPEPQLLPIPDGLEMAQAATFPVAFLTAWYAIAELCRLRPKQSVLVHSAAGGVGGALVQLAKRAGAEVVAVVSSSHKVRVAREHGADVVIDKSVEALWPAAERAAPSGFHAVFDANGAETLRQGYRHLAPTGRLVIYGFHTMLGRGSDRLNVLKALIEWLKLPRLNPLDMTDKNVGVLAFNLSYLFDEIGLFHESMRELVGALEKGELRPAAVTEVPFAEVRRAHQMLHSGDTVGKIALVV
ncbi:MAG TPA: zinc-binding dehydrogenase [Polyangiaceae bacterium]